MSANKSPRTLRSKPSQQPSPPILLSAKEKMSTSFENRLNKQMSDCTSELKSLIMDVNKNLSLLSDKLDKIVLDFNSRIEDVTNTISALTTRVDELESQQSAKIKETSQKNAEISQLQGTLDRMHREQIITDALLHGVPQTADENLADMFNTLCTSIKCPAISTPKQIFRMKPRTNSTNSTDAAIIIKFQSVADKITLLKSINDMYTTSKQTLCLRHLGMVSDSRIYLNESLTPYNRIILRKAFQLKRQNPNKLSSVFTRNGCVYVRLTPKGKAFRIDHSTDLDQLVATARKPNDDNDF